MSFQSSTNLTLIRFRRVMLKHFFKFRKFIIAGFLLVAVILALPFFSAVAQLAKEFVLGPVNIFSVVFPKNSTLKNNAGRTNILLLGIGGTGHDGPNLTDAIIVLSVAISSSAVGSGSGSPVILISIPRDIYLDSLGDKINSAYQTGVDKGVGTTLTKGVVSQVTGLPVHYAIVADFSAFDDVIDILGGIDINVEHTLDDGGYPIEGKENDTCGYPAEEVATRSAAITVSPASEIAAFPCRYEHIHFDPGLQHMDGTTALKFVRSRHAEGDEGTDFARSRRQQLALKAIQNKVLSSQTLLSPQTILGIYSQLKSHVSSDMSSAETSQLVNLALQYKDSKIKTVTFETLLENPPVDYRGWILLPKGGSWDEVHADIKNSLQSQE